MGDLSKNFSTKEFISPDTGVCRMQPEFIERLQRCRDEYGKPMRVVSGFRSIEYNKKIGGAPNSAHCRGYAADISCTSSSNRMQMMRIFLKHFPRIGIANLYLHIDCDPSLPQDVMWHYYSEFRSYT